MLTATEVPNKWRRRLVRWTITSLLMGVSFAAGAMIVAVLAARILIPISATGMTMGLIGMASAGAHATTSALYSGDSEARLTVLKQLKESFDAQPTQTFDAQVAAWLLPALEQCKTDADPEVVQLAEELAVFIKANTSAQPSDLPALP